MLNKNPSDLRRGEKVCSIVKFYISTLSAYYKFNSHNSTKLLNSVCFYTLTLQL